MKGIQCYARLRNSCWIWGLLFGAVVSMTGCSVEHTENSKLMEPETARAISFDFIGGQDVMPIAGFFGPYISAKDVETNGEYVDYVTDECFKLIAEAGINLISYAPLDYDSQPQKLIESLVYGERYGVAVVVYDSYIERLAFEKEISLENVRMRLAEYEAYPAFAGVYLTDEPCTDYFLPEGYAEDWKYLESSAALASVLNEDLDLFTYANAYPSGDDGEVYERYLRDFTDTLKPKYLQFDRYPFYCENPTDLNLYLQDLAVVRKVAEENEIPFWAFIQAGSQFNDMSEKFDSVKPYYPSEGQMDWSINMALAFGAQGIDYFPLIQPYFYAIAESAPYDYERNGIIGADGNKTQWYDYVQRMSQHIQAIDEVLMNSVNKGVLACGEVTVAELQQAATYGAVLNGTSWNQLQTVVGEALVGCFNYHGRTALYAVNYLTDSSQQIQLLFDAKYKLTTIQAGEIKHWETEELTMEFLSGEGILIVLE